MSETGVVHVAGDLLEGLGDGCRHGPVLLAQLRCAGEGIRCYRRNGASVTSPTRVPIVHLVARHLRAALLLVV
jgi:hypothetical protein